MTNDELDKSILSKCTKATKAFYLKVINTKVVTNPNETREHSYYIDDKVYKLTYRLHYLLVEEINGVEPWFSFVASGYSLLNAKHHLNNFEKIQPWHIKRALESRVKQKLSGPNTQAYKAALIKGAKMDKWDAQRVLKEAVAVYESTKDDKPTQALRALELIGKHVLVDAFVSNRVIVENKLDYATLLQEASSRAIEAPKEPEVPKDIDIH